jgi:ParB family chromosome partitioning protein
MNKQISSIATNQLEPNPLQPRGHFETESLNELIESIREHGILEPLIIAKTPAGYQIIAGERRWRAARALKLEYVPAIVKETTPQQMLEMAIVENVQRKDLNPLERAKAFNRLKEEFSLDNEKIAKKVVEEAFEVAIASVEGKTHKSDKKQVIMEASDLIYHLFVLLISRKIEISEVISELNKRANTSGLEEKARRKK